MTLKFTTTKLIEEAARKAVLPFIEVQGHSPRGLRKVLQEEALKVLSLVNMPVTDHEYIGKLAKEAKFH